MKVRLISSLMDFEHEIKDQFIHAGIELVFSAFWQDSHNEIISTRGYNVIILTDSREIVARLRKDISSKRRKRIFLIADIDRTRQYSSDLSWNASIFKHLKITTAEHEQSHKALLSLYISAINEALRYFKHQDAGGQLTEIQGEDADTKKLRELAEDIDRIADAIADLRLNSTGDVVDSLRRISRNIQTATGSLPSEIRQEISVQTASRDVLQQLSAVFDVVHSQRLAGIIVSGAVSALVGSCGWPAATCFGVSMAAWHGKDAFITAIGRLPFKKSGS